MFAKAGGEFKDKEGVYTRMRDVLHLLLESRHHRGYAVGLQKVVGVSVEGDRHARTPPPGGEASHLGEELLVAPMDAVKLAERDGRAGKAALQVLPAPDNDH